MTVLFLVQCRIDLQFCPLTRLKCEGSLRLYIWAFVWGLQCIDLSSDQKSGLTAIDDDLYTIVVDRCDKLRRRYGVEVVSREVDCCGRVLHKWTLYRERKRNCISRGLPLSLLSNWSSFWMHHPRVGQLTMVVSSAWTILSNSCAKPCCNMKQPILPSTYLWLLQFLDSS